MKVLYISHTGLISGAERALLDLLDALPGDVDPIVATPPGPLVTQLRQRDIPVVMGTGVTGGFRLSPIHTSRAVADLIAGGIRLRRLTAQIRPTIVHANTTRAGLMLSAAGPLPGRPPRIIHAHDVLPESRSARLVSAALARGCDTVIANSAYTARSLERLGYHGRAEVHFNPLDIDRFDNSTISRETARTVLKLPQNAIVLVVVAQITPWKGQTMAIEALAGLRQRYPDLRLLLIGEAKFASGGTSFDNVDYVKRLRRLISDLGLEHHVEFWGERSDVETILRASDVALTPSWEEPFGRSVTEAMALGTPVVATSAGGTAEYIEHGQNGFLVSPWELDQWVEAVGALLDDPALRQAVGERAAATVRSRFSRDRYATSMVELYRELSDGRPVAAV